jgi:hypothetical protein
VFAFKFELFNLKIELSKKKYLVHGVPHFASPSVTHVPYFASYEKTTIDLVIYKILCGNVYVLHHLV